MKIKNNNTLWILNTTTLDVHISDLGIKVPAGKTVNVYKLNPYLTKAQVSTSMDTGALAKRIGSKILSIVSGPVKDTKRALEIIKEVKESNAKALKTKSSFVLTSGSSDSTSDDGFEFADYGVSEIKQPESDDQSTVSKQSQNVMSITKVVLTDTTGPHVPMVSVPSAAAPVVVAKSNNVNTIQQTNIIKSEDSLFVGEPKSRSIKTIRNEQDGTSTSDESCIAMNESYDANVATKLDNDLVAVIKVKEKSGKRKSKVKSNI